MTTEQALPNKDQVQTKINELTSDMQKALQDGDFQALGRLTTEAKRQESILADIAFGEAKDSIASWQIPVQEQLDDLQTALNGLGFALTMQYNQIENGWALIPSVTMQGELHDKILALFAEDRPDVVSTAKYEYDAEHGVYAVIVGTGKSRVRATNGTGNRNNNPYMKDGKAYTLGEAFEVCATAEQRAQDVGYTSEQRSARNAFRVKTVTDAGFKK